MNRTPNGAYTGAVINAADDGIPFDWTDADLCPSLLVEENLVESDASELETVELYSIEDAVIRMLELNREYLYKDLGKYVFDGVARHLEDALMFAVGGSQYGLTLAGYEFRNPFNAYGVDEALFPREAYYQWWKDDPHGLPCPAWFEDLRKADEYSASDQSVVADNAAPGASVGDDQALGLGCSSGRMDDDLSDAINFGRCTRKVLTVIAEYLRRPEERQMLGGDPKRKAESLMRAMEASARKEKWGTNRGLLSNEQWQAIRTLMLPESTGGGCVAAMWGGRTHRDKKRRD